MGREEREEEWKRRRKEKKMDERVEEGEAKEKRTKHSLVESPSTWEHSHP